MLHDEVAVVASVVWVCDSSGSYAPLMRQANAFGWWVCLFVDELRWTVAGERPTVDNMSAAKPIKQKQLQSESGKGVRAAEIDSSRFRVDLEGIICSMEIKWQVFT